MPAQSTYTAIQTYTNASNFNNIQFTGIPQTYTDLFVVIYARGTAALTITQSFVFLNSDGSNSNYSMTDVVGNGSAATSTRATRGGGSFGVITNCPGASATAGVFGTSVMHIMNYSNTTTLKTALNRDAMDLNGSGNTFERITLYNSTAAISSLYFQSGSGNFVGGSQITLYGIAAA
jgi:hypothetical protein